jgi:hypothetical protein
LTDEEWTPQNGLVTAAQKLNRRNILEHYAEEVKVNYPIPSPGGFIYVLHWSVSDVLTNVFSGWTKPFYRRFTLEQ